MADGRWLLDSNICIHLLRGEPAILRTRVQETSSGSLYLSTVSLAELTVGLRGAGSERSLAALLNLLTILPFDEAAGRRYGTLPFRRNSFDRLIAAHALSLDITLVTNSERDFTDISGLRIENWAMPKEPTA